MYHALIARLVRRNFDQVNRRETAAVLAGCAPDIHHRFGGDHALGGERHDRAALERWFARLYRLAPDLNLAVTDVWVKGWPHRTVAIARWTNTQTHPDGTPYRNHGVHVITLRWGKAVAIDANEDSQAVVALLRQLADRGVTEADAAPIIS